MTKNIWAMACLGLLGVASRGCLLGGGGGTPEPNAGEEPYLAEYDQLQASLDSRRSVFLDEQAMEVEAVGQRIYWKEYAEWEPSLHSRDLSNNVQVDYAFSIGGGDDANVRTSDRALATASVSGQDVVYRLYDAAQTDVLLGEATFAIPADEQKWWAYAVDGTTLYVMTTGEATELYRMEPGGQPEPLTNLESAGCDVGEFWDFAVDGDSVVFVESGRLWQLSLAAHAATWLENRTEIDGAVQIETDGVLFESADGPFFFDFAKAQPLDLRAAISANAYRLNEGFAAAHLYDEDLARWGDELIYIGNSGVFAYNWKQDRIAPILLAPRSADLRIDYRYPVVADDGTLLVTGLTSTTGAVGAEGPTYRVSLPAVLP